jgi:hypothetical protein
MAKRERTENTQQQDKPEVFDRPARPRRSLLKRALLGGLPLIVLLIALTPTIISQTSLGPSIVAAAAKGQIDGTLEARSLSIGWFSPVVLRGVTITDPEAHTIATIESLVIDRSLLSLIRNQQDLGTITIDAPRLSVVARANGSNLEDLLAPLLSKPSTGAPLPTLTLDVHGGVVKLLDATTNMAWEITPIEAHVESPRGSENAWKVASKVNFNDTSVEANVTQVLGEQASTQATLQADRFPLDPLQPLLTRLLGPVRLTGGLSGKIAAELADGGKRQSVKLDGVDVQKITFASEKLLGPDIFRISQVKAEGSANLASGVWQLRDLELQSDVAALVGSGDVQLSDLAGSAAAQSDGEVQGVIDLARLMQMLPNTLRARAGVELTSGQARVSLTSQAVAGGHRLSASLSTENVQANNAGRTIALRQPVQVDAAVVLSEQGWQIEKVDAKSSFLTAGARGTLDAGKLTLQGDLSKLAAELDQFIDLGELRMAGQFGGGVQWQREQGDTLSVGGKLTVRSLELASPGVLPWREDNLVVTMQAQGISPTKYSVTSGKAAVRAGQDELDIVLQQGVDAADATAPLPVDVRLIGTLESWLPRLQGFVPLAGWQASGPITLTAKGTASAAKIDIAQADLNLKQLRVEGPSLHVAEPEVTAQLQGSFEVASGAIQVDSAVIRSSAVAASAEKLIVQLGKQPKISGEIAGRGDVGRVMAWLQDPRQPVTSQFAGHAEAEASFTLVDGVTKANLKGQIADLAYLTRPTPPAIASGRVPAREAALGGWQTAWSEPLVTFGGDAAYDLAHDSLSLDKMQAVAGTSAVVASGTVSQLASQCLLDLQGEIRYDLATWTPKVQPLLGPSFDMTGTAAKPFEVHGPLLAVASAGNPGDAPLLPIALTGKAGLGWQGAQWMALVVGPAEVSAELKDSTISVLPTKIPLSQGTLQLAPTITLRGSNWLVTHPSGKVIDHIVITPQMCDTWIKYVMPPLAGATEAHGQFSVDLENLAVPLQQPTALDTKGTFTIHNVSVGPGAMASSLISVAQQVKAFTSGKAGLESLAGGLAGQFGGGQPAATPTSRKQWLELPEQQVPVQVSQGRVYHEGLTITTKEFTILSTGSVGIVDQTIQLVCEVPLRDEWLKDAKFASLKGQTLKIPVKGTITDPKPDLTNAFGGLVGLGTAGIKGAITGQLEKVLPSGGTGANSVQSEVGKVQDKIQGQLDKGKQKLEGQLQKGLKGLFKSP